MASPANWMDGLLNAGLVRPWVERAAAAGRITPDMTPAQAHRAIADFFMESKSPQAARQLQLPMGSTEDEIRALIPYGSRGPGVPVSPDKPTLYTPGMQEQAIAQGVEVVANGPRVISRGGGLIPTPVDPRRFVMSDPPAGTGYTPEMMDASVRHGLERPLPVRDVHDEVAPGVRGLPGRVATPEELEALARSQGMYQGAAGRVDDIAAGSSPSRALVPVGLRGRGMPVDGPAGGPRGLITTPSFGRQMQSLVRRGLDGLGGGELLAAAATVGAADALGRMAGGQISTGGEAELANESRPVPVVEATETPQPVEWAADKVDPAAEARFTENFKKGYLKREDRMHPDASDLSPQKRQSLMAMMKAGIPQQRANEIVRGKYSMTPAELGLLRGSR